MPEVKTNKPPRFYTFAMILYPDCEAHCRLIEYFPKFPKIFKPVWILHDRDTYDDADREEYIQENDGKEPSWSVGDLKKPHWHVMITKPEQATISAVSKFLGVKKVEGVSSASSYLLYMLHQTPDSWNKHPYEVSDLVGDKKQIEKVMSQNANFVQLGRYADLIENGASLCDIVRHVISSENQDILVSSFDQYNHFITAMSNQYDRRKNQSLGMQVTERAHVNIDTDTGEVLI